MTWFSITAFFRSPYLILLQEIQYRNENSGFNWLLLLTIIFGFLVSGIVIWHLNNQNYKSHFEKKYNSIGGWLIIVGIGAMITPLFYLLKIYRQWDKQKNVDYYFHYFQKDSVFFSPLKGYYTLFTIFFDIMMLVYAVFLVTIFFQQRASFRPHYTLFKLLTLFFLIMDVLIIHHTHAHSEGLDTKRLLTRQYISLTSLFIGTCIWVPYVWFSERSKHTFINETGDEE
jgi:hypothetical protein